MDRVSEGPDVDIVHVSSLMYPVPSTLSCRPCLIDIVMSTLSIRHCRVDIVMSTMSYRHCHVDIVNSTLSCRPCPVDAGPCIVSVELTNHCCHMKSHRNLSYIFCHICTVHYLIHCNNYLSK